jgi:O-antigen ligase
MADLSICICAILFLITVIKKKEWFYFKNYFFYFFLLFFFYIFIRSVVTLNLDSIETAIFYFRFGLFSLAVWHVINNNQNFLKYFFYICLIIFLILSMDAIYQYYTGYNILGYPKHSSYNKVSSFFERKYILGSFIVRIFPIILGIFFFKYYSILKKRFLYPEIFFIFTIAFLAVIFSGERAALFLALLYLFLIFIISKFKIIHKVIIFCVYLLFLTSIFFHDSKIFYRYITQVYEQITYNKQLKEKGIGTNYNKDYLIFSVDHQGHYRVSFNMFRDNILFGQGPKMFRILCDNDKFKYEFRVNQTNQVISGCTTHPHNSYMQLFAETGLLGAMFLLFFFSYVVFKIFYNCFVFQSSKKKNNIFNYKTSLLLCFLINFFPFIPTGNFFNNWLSILYYLPMGFYLNITNGKL